MLKVGVHNPPLRGQPHRWLAPNRSRLEELPGFFASFPEMRHCQRCCPQSGRRHRISPTSVGLTSLGRRIGPMSTEYDQVMKHLLSLLQDGSMEPGSWRVAGETRQCRLAVDLTAGKGTARRV